MLMLVVTEHEKIFDKLEDIFKLVTRINDTVRCPGQDTL